MSRQRPLVIGVGPGQIVIPPEALHWQFARSSGPATCPDLPEPVRLRLLARERSRLTAEGELVIASQRHREQGRNVADCRAKLSAIIERALAPPKTRRPTRVPRAARAARLDAKKRRGATKRLRQPPAE